MKCTSNCGESSIVESHIIDSLAQSINFPSLAHSRYISPKTKLIQYFIIDYQIMYSSNEKSNWKDIRDYFSLTPTTYNSIYWNRIIFGLYWVLLSIHYFITSLLLALSALLVTLLFLAILSLSLISLIHNDSGIAILFHHLHSVIIIVRWIVDKK